MARINPQRPLQSISNLNNTNEVEASKPTTTKKIKTKAKAVWFYENRGKAEIGDVVIGPNGGYFRKCNKPDGSIYWKETNVHHSDYEHLKGDIRRPDCNNGRQDYYYEIEE